MAQLKDLIVNGASQLIGDVYTSQIQISKLNALTGASATTYGPGTSGQVLMSNGTNSYWGTPAATVTESTVSGWGFTKNTGTITGATANGGLKVTGTTLGHSNTAITAKTTAGVYPVKIDALGHITEAGTAIVSSTAASGGSTLSLVTTGEKYTWNNKSNLAIGTTATTAAAGNHTHTTSLATDSGTPTITLARSTTYKLTAGGTSVIFKTPADAHVMQSASGANYAYKLLFTTTDSPTSGDSGPVFYNSNMTINPSTSTITATNFNGTATKATQDSDGNAINTTYVKKSGDTMTGALIFNSSGNSTYPYVKRTDIDSSVTSLSSAKYGMVTGIKDNNDSWIGWVETVISTSGENQVQLAARKPVNGSNVNNALALKVAANGTKTAVFESDVLPKTDNALNLGSSSNRWKNMYAANFTGSFTGNLTGTATSFGKGSHTAAVTANEFGLERGMATLVGNVSNTTMPKISNANAEMIIKAHPTSGTNYYEARLGFSSDANLYYMPVNETSWKKLIYEDKMCEANLQWGGKNFSASYGCIDAAMIGELGANRFAFLHPDGITCEYSTDGGSTWIDYGWTGTGKSAIFSVGNGMYLGKHTTTGSSTVNDQLRITIDTSLAKIYTVLNKIALYISTNGAQDVKVKIEKATHAAQTTFQTHLDWTQISGYSGWNILNIDNLTTYGNTDSQYQKIRFTFKQEIAGTNKAASISKIYAFGGMGWTTPSNMASSGHLYSYDRDQIAFFPNTIQVNNSVAVRARDKDNTALAQGSFASYNKTGRVVGQMIYQHSSNSSDYDIVNTGQWMFRQYSPKTTPENATTGYAEVYKLPVVDSNITGSSKSYDILTTKLHFKNKTVAAGTSGWTGDDTTYSGFPYKANIACSGVTANHVPNVIFDYNELTSGNFCPFADSGDGIVSIYCKIRPTTTITIPTIYCV